MRWQFCGILALTGGDTATALEGTVALIPWALNCRDDVAEKLK